MKMTKLSDIRLNDGTHGVPKNPRFIRDEKFKKLCQSVKDFPEAMPARGIVVDENGVILGGNMRYRACKEIGMKEIPSDWVKRLEGLTVEQKRRFVIMDNRSFGEDDFDLLANEWDIEELLNAGFDASELDSMLEENDEEKDAEPQIDRGEELNKNWKVERGQLWSVGNHKLMCGDSTSKEDFNRLMSTDKATCVFTDPPYGVSIGKKNEMLNTFQPSGRCLTSLDADDMKPEELKKMLLGAFKNAREYMADDCSVFVCSPQGGGLGMMMMMMMQESYLEVRHILNWVKNCPTFSMGHLDYDYQHEPILFTWTKTHKRKKEGQWQTSLWTADKPLACKEHPTMKPVELPINAILNHTDKNDIVLDMFGGSGTTMVAAENTGRSGRIIELSPNFCAVILERMKTAFPNIKIERCN